jgi:transposase
MRKIQCISISTWHQLRRWVRSTQADAAPFRPPARRPGGRGRRLANLVWTTSTHDAFSLHMSSHHTVTSPYYAMIRSTDTTFALRHNLGVHALHHGLRATAAHFGCSRNTVRKWLRRYRHHHLQGLHAHSRAPHSCPHKTKSPLENKIVALRKKTPGFGARRLIAEFALPLGHNAVGRILRAHELTRQRKRRHQTKRDLRTALGAEFDGDTVHLQPDDFIGTIEQRWGARHEFNPPHCPNANADVETVHSTIEGEFFDAPCFDSRADFFAKINTYQLWYNAARKNSSRGWCSPLELLAQKAPRLSPSIFLLPPLPLEHLLTPKAGHDVPRHPAPVTD